LRQLKESQAVALAACEAVKKAGFINYYGLQRFGKGNHRTHEFGLAIFKKDYKLVCSYLFEHSDIDTRSRSFAGGGDVVAGKAAARKGNYAEALKLLPRNMHIERCVAESLAKNPTDYASALQKVPKFSRLMYVHAYQSYLWNSAATERIRLYGLAVVPGDLVLAHRAGTGTGVGAVQLANIVEE
jgi:tRNA pseudouridine13 synthase